MRIRVLAEVLSIVLLATSVPQAGDDLYTKTSRDISATPSLAASPADTGFNNDVWAIGTYNGDLVVGGYFTLADGFAAIKVAGWNGASWYPMNYFPNGNPIYWLHEHNGLLYAGQALTQLCSWDGNSWTGHTPWLGNTFGNIYALETYDNELYVGGGFDGNVDQPSYIARWNGAGWDTVGTGITGGVRVLDTFGGDLIAGGFFSTGDGSVADRIARWNGTSWSPIGSGISGGVYALTTYNSELIAAGFFTTAGGNAANNIAKWNGASWQPLGDGLDGWVQALTVHDNKLIAGGRFLNSGGTPTARIASWDGATWSPIGSGFDDDVYALGVYNGYLIAGGAFSDAGGYVALWDGGTWRPVSDVVTGVEDDDAHVPRGFSLDQNYPNPFNPTTQIAFAISKPGVVRIVIFNVLGEQIRELLNEPFPAGRAVVSWDGTDDAGARVASGTYFYRVAADGVSESRKMLLLK